jgi:TPP-dependent pyruvate/acetoin dehydrogenase alpha subunit
VLKQYMAKGDSPTRGRELNIHFGDVGDPATTRGFLGQISPLGDMVPVMAGVTLSFRLRGEDRVGLVYVGDGATSTGAFHEGINLAAVQRCPLVVVVENNGYAYSTPTHKQTLARRFVDKAVGYGVAGARADGNDVLAVYDVTKEAVDRARAGGGVTLVELVTYRRKGHAEHDNQSYVPEGEIERWAAENDPVDRYVAASRASRASPGRARRRRRARAPRGGRRHRRRRGVGVPRAARLPHGHLRRPARPSGRSGSARGCRRRSTRTSAPRVGHVPDRSAAQPEAKIAGGND